MKSNTVRCTGIGLIEVLITTVVIALGLLAVARFQVGVIGESRDNKAMVEARNYCESGIEDLRSSVSRFTLDEDDVEVFWATSDGSPFEDTYVGKNATYARSMVVENLLLPTGAATPTDEDVREKRVTATCSWDGGEVELQTVLTLHGANSSALAAGLGGGGRPAISPSLNAGSSDEISEVLPLQPSDLGYGNAGQVVDIDGELYVVQSNGESAAKSELCTKLDPAPLSFENGLRARRVDNDGYAGMESIELFEVVPDGRGTLCVPRVRFNGGVVIPIRGVVHSRATDNTTLVGLELFTLNVSESGAYCIFNPSAGATSAPYTCYVGGNCAYGPIGIDEDFTQCPSQALPNLLESVGEGGWRGRVGLLNVASPLLADGSTDKPLNVCFLEETTSQDFGGRDTARSYFSYNTRGTDSTSDDRSQGINKPYACHDFLIVDGKPNDRQLSQTCEAQANAVSGLKLASKTIRRDIATESYANAYESLVNVDSCSGGTATEYTITGGLQNAVGVPVVQVSDGVSTRDCAVGVGSGAYSCTFTTDESRVEISAIQGISKFPQPPCSLTLPPLGSGCVIEFPVDPGLIYTISGFVTGDEIGTQLTSAGGALKLEVQYGELAAGCSVGEYAGGGRSYVCEFVDPRMSSVILYATASGQHSVRGYPDVVALPADGGGEISGPPLVVDSVTNTFEITGKIWITAPPLKNNETLTPSVNPELSINCSDFVLPALNAGTSTVDYGCTVTAGQRTVSYSISPGCLKDKGKEYKLSMIPTLGSGVIQTSGIGSLILDLGNVVSDVVIDVEISRTEELCE